MLAIRMQRTGRRGHAQFRVIVQDSKFSPTSGRVVALLGNYNPHTKQVSIDKERAQQYLTNGAQPTERVAKILKSEGVKLPEWFAFSEPSKKAIKTPEKLRRNRPKEPASEETPAEDKPETEAAEKSAESAPETPETAAEVAAESETKDMPEEKVEPAENPAATSE